MMSLLQQFDTEQSVKGCDPSKHSFQYAIKQIEVKGTLLRDALRLLGSSIIWPEHQGATRPSSNYQNLIYEPTHEQYSSIPSYTISPGSPRSIPHKQPARGGLGVRNRGRLHLYQQYYALLKRGLVYKIYRYTLHSDYCHFSRATADDRGGEAEKKNAFMESACGPVSSAKQSTLGKRKSKPDKNKDDDDEAEDEDDGKAKRKKHHQGVNRRRVRFACPFRKHDPQTYAILRDHARCAVAKLPSVSRVKEHLFRCHLAPIHCPRCWCTFDASKDLEDHLKAENICNKRDNGHRPNGITAEQQQMLRSRKKSPAAQSEEERWMEIYQLLFPDEPCPTSPYVEEVYDNGPQAGLIDANNYRDYAQREIPNIFRSQLARLAEGPQVLGSDALIWVVQQCQDELLFNYSLQATGLGENTATQLGAYHSMGHNVGSTTSNATSNPIFSGQVADRTPLPDTDCYLAMFPETAFGDIPGMSMDESSFENPSNLNLDGSNINTGTIETGTDMDHDCWELLE